jgi:Uma2 family endonuclease
MPTETPRVLLEIRYYEAAQDYLRKLPLEHFMEATPQATQRKITLESLDLVQARRPDFQLFNELLVQYPLPRKKRLGQVVPDNMVVIHSEPIKAEGSYDVPLQPVGPFWVLDYVSKGNRRKDYDDNMRKYEHELKVPYYLLFAPDEQELTLYRHNDERYVSVPPNEQGRHELSELKLEVGLLDGWVRYWYQGELLPLPAELQRDLEETRRQLVETTQRADAEKRRADAEHRCADAEHQARLTAERDLSQLRSQIEQLRSQQKNEP